MAIRYSGGLSIRMQWINEHGMSGNGTYRCVVSSGKDRAVVFVGAAAHITEAVDSPASYDDVAASAITFADFDDETERSSDRFSRFADYDESGCGPIVLRKRPEYLVARRA